MKLKQPVLTHAACRYIHHAVTSAQSYFPCSVTVEDEAALKPGRPYVVGEL